MYYIGIDGGGTKTAFGLFDETGKLMEQINLSTCHFLQVGFVGCAHILMQGIEILMNHHHLQPREVYIGIGIAGYGSDQQICQQLEEHLNEILSTYQCALTNDIHIALIGALDNQDGIVAIAGTGSIAMASINKEIIRCGGWGYALGDEGSAYWIGKELLSLFTKQSDGRKEKDAVYQAILDYYQITNPYQIIDQVNQFKNMRTEVAKLAKLCSDLAITTTSCKEILVAAAKEISPMIKTLSHRFNKLPIVTYYGGVFNNKYFKESFINEVKDVAMIQEPRYNALMGAYMLAKNKYL